MEDAAGLQGRISRLVLEPGTEGSEVALRLSGWARQRGIPVCRAAAGEDQDAHAAPDQGIGPSKQVLRVVQQRGAVLKPCTGLTDSLLCCNLQVVAQTVGCPLDCSYCVLQDYQNRSQITVAADSGALLERLAQELAERPRRLHRVCTGQVADSLALEPALGFAGQAVQRLARVPNVLLELKTKTARVDSLLELEHRGRTVISWSISPPAVARAEEHGCAPLSARLEAAARAAAAGYLVAFHLDPMITGADHAADLEQYQALAARALAAVPPECVTHVSMGSVRFLPSMGRTLSVRFPRSRVPLGELLSDVDGKLRLLAPLRVQLYRAVARQIRAACPGAFLYLCMEPAGIWRRALDTRYEDRQQLEWAFADSLHRRFGLAPVTPRIADYGGHGPAAAAPRLRPPAVLD